MTGHDTPRQSIRKRLAYLLLGTGSLAWLLLRSGRKPRRLAYPCQQAALATSLGFLGYLASLVGGVGLIRRLRRRSALAGSILTIVLFAILLGLGSSTVPPPPSYADLVLPSWTSPTAVSNVYAVSGVPTPQCSLDGGALPGSPPCNDPAYALADAGVDLLIGEMANRGDHFYQTATHPGGVVGAGDVVVVKINNQWAYNGGNRRLCTNTDVLKGLIWRTLQHPDSFIGEIVVAEHTQGVVWDWDVSPANSQDQDQSIQEVIDTFQGLGFPVSLYRWDSLDGNAINGGDVGGVGYPAGEYAQGNMTDAYILLEDAAGSGTNELSYPKFQTAEGTYVSMRYGIWNGSSYEADRLTFINMPVLKQHGMAGATIAWKNLIGFITNTSNSARFGSWALMHDFFWGYTGDDDQDYGLLGRQMALVRTPDLNIVDAIWVADDNYDGTGYRQDILLASTDPFAVDWYASEYILYAVFANQDASAARAGTFRDATRTNQNAAEALWPGTYPYIDLLDGYDGDVPSDGEHDQLNVYLVTGGVVPPSLTLLAPNGGEEWTVGDQELIQWSSTGTVGDVGLDYSTDGFATSHPIVASTADDGTYLWTIPDDPSAMVRVRVASVVSSTTVHDASDANFTIVEPAPGSYTLSAIITPLDATEPVDYLWSPEPNIGQGTASATYLWGPGTHQVTVEASNCGGIFTDSFTHTVGALLPASAGTQMPAAPAQVTMAFQDEVSPNAGYAGTADVILARDADDHANLGGLENLESYYSDGIDERRSLMRWDISALPAGITVEAATVELYRYNEAQADATQLSLYRLTSAWLEGTGYELYPDPGYVPDGATWLTATTTIPWNSPGGDYDPTQLDQLTLPAGTGSGWIRLDATDAVRDWVDGSEGNYGLLLRPESGDWTVHYYHSREGATPSLRPRLVVTYTSGAPTPELAFVAPTAATQWPISSSQQIRWETTGLVAQVNLTYSLGDSFMPIESEVVNTGVYTWTTPVTPTASAQLRLESVISPTAVFDISDYFRLIDTVVTSQTVYLPLVAKADVSCPRPLTAVSITEPGG